MPFVDHNDSQLREAIEHETGKTRDLLLKLRHAVEHGQTDKPPQRYITELGRHASLLAKYIAQVTVRHEIIDVRGEVLYNEYEEVIPFVDNEVRQDPALLSLDVLRAGMTNEYQIYREDLGFSAQEYEDLRTWTESLSEHPLDMTAAWDVFTTKILRDLEKAKYSVELKEIVTGVTGIVSISVDTVSFVATAGIAVPALVGSCTSGIAAIAMSFPEVRRKLLQRGH